MLMEFAFFGLCLVLFLTHLVCCCVNGTFKKTPIPRQDSDVWNISGHVTGQGDRWPTHDHHLSMDSFVYPDGINKEYGCAPPPYTKVDLPTYEEAICAMESHKATTITVPVHGSTPTITSPIQQV